MNFLTNILDTISNKKLHKELRLAKEKYQRNNYAFLIEKLKIYARDFELQQSGLLITEWEQTQRAISLFWQAKRDGRIDELNCIAKVEEQV